MGHEDPEKRKQSSRRYYERHKEEIKQLREQHKEERKQYFKQYREQHKEEIKQREKQYREQHKEQINQIQKQYRERNKEKGKQNNWKHQGILLLPQFENYMEQFLWFYNKNGGRCYICGKELEPYGKSNSFTTAHLDHNHTTGYPRGILCSKCNTGIGLFKDSPDLLQNAIAYLKSNNIEAISLEH